MQNKYPSSLPKTHSQFLGNVVDKLRADARFVGIAIGGSYLTNSLDEFSDLDLIIAIETKEYSYVMDERRVIAKSFGELLSAFTGEHVGEPRLLICLYNNPLLHIDLKFVNLDYIGNRVEDPEVLWERDERFSQKLKEGEAEYPTPDLQWIEDRFWVWMHYLAIKIGRGELFEALDGFAFLRKRVFGPLCLLRAGKQPAGVRRIETEAPEFMELFHQTVAKHDRADCLRATRACVKLYRVLRGGDDSIKISKEAERVALEYVGEIEERA